MEVFILSFCRVSALWLPNLYLSSRSMLMPSRLVTLDFFKFCFFNLSPGSPRKGLLQLSTSISESLDDLLCFSDTLACGKLVLLRSCIEFRPLLLCLQSYSSFQHDPIRLPESLSGTFSGCGVNRWISGNYL